MSALSKLGACHDQAVSQREPESLRERCRRLLDLDPCATEIEQREIQVAAIRTILRDLRVLPEDEAEELLLLFAIGHRCQGIESITVEKPDGRGHKEADATMEQCVELLCDIREFGCEKVAEWRGVEAESIRRAGRRARKKLGF